MPREIRKTVYTFAELLELEKSKKATATAVEHARHWLREAATDGEWYDYTFELWKQALEQIGFSEADISFRGFSSQGDGASFVSGIGIAELVDFLSTAIEPSATIAGDPEDFRPWLVKQLGSKTTEPKYARLKWAADYIDAKVIRTSHQYCHENTCRAELDLRDRAHRDWDFRGEYKSRTPKLRALFDQFAKDVEELRYDLSKAIYRVLEEDYEAQTEDEALLEFAEANDYTFTIGGKREG